MCLAGRVFLRMKLSEISEELDDCQIFIIKNTFLQWETTFVQHETSRDYIVCEISI